MRALINFAAHRATRIMIGGTIAAGFYITTLMFGPSIEAQIWPVVNFHEISQVRDGSRVIIETSFTKRRNCEYVSSQWYGVLPSGESMDVPVDYHNQATGITRPLGAQRDRNWVLTLPSPDIKSVFVLLHYRCGFPWLTYTMSGPYPVPKA